ncbi:MAG: hypothetical protein AAFR33_07040, partial [Pseudomonadota bacterium]
VPVTAIDRFEPRPEPELLDRSMSADHSHLQPIAALWNGLDDLLDRSGVAEGLPQHGDGAAQAVIPAVLKVPDVFDEQVARHNVASMFRQQAQNIHDAWLKGDRPTSASDEIALGLGIDRAEREGLWYCLARTIHDRDPPTTEVD